MRRQEENQKVIDACEGTRTFDTIEQVKVECMKLMATALFDISKSLAIIADNTKNGGPNNENNKM